MDLIEDISGCDLPVGEAGVSLRERLTGERARDWSVAMSYSLPKALFKERGWHPSGSGQGRAVMRSLVANGVMAFFGSATGRASISRSKQRYADKARHRHDLQSYRSVVWAMEQAVRLGLLEEHRAKPGDHLRTGKQTTFEVTPTAIEAFGNQRITRDDAMREIVMRDAEGNDLLIEETPELEAKRDQVRRINLMLANVSIDLPDGCREVIPHMWDVPTKNGRMRVWLDDLRIHRVFNRGDWACNGRLYGLFQSLPKAVRAAMLLDGESVVEIDYAYLHIAMLMARRGLVLDHDPYVIDGFERKQGKLALLIALNARNRHEAVSAIHDAFRDSGMDRRTARRLLDAVIDANPSIAPDIASDAGIGLMHDDAEIALSVIEEMLAGEIAVLPIHDSFIVQARHEGALRSAMDRAMAAYVARFSHPVVAVEVTEAVVSQTEIAPDSETAPQMEWARPALAWVPSVGDVGVSVGSWPSHRVERFDLTLLPAGCVASLSLAGFAEACSPSSWKRAVDLGLYVLYVPSSPLPAEVQFHADEGMWPDPDSAWSRQHRVGLWAPKLVRQAAVRSFPRRSRPSFDSDQRRKGYRSGAPVAPQASRPSDAGILADVLRAAGFGSTVLSAA